jgi:hypothetical protein
VVVVRFGGAGTATTGGGGAGGAGGTEAIGVDAAGRGDVDVEPPHLARRGASEQRRNVAGPGFIARRIPVD